MKKLLAISILFLSLCNMNVVRCALMHLGDNSEDGMSQVVVSEDAELRGQANHANYLCLLPQYIRAIIDGYAVGLHLFPKLRIGDDWDGQMSLELLADTGKFFLPVSELTKSGSLFADPMGVFGVIVKIFADASEVGGLNIEYTIYQETYANGLLPQETISCVTTHTPFSFLNKATAACMQVSETAEGKKEVQIFTPLIEGEEEEAYSAPCWDVFNQNEKSGASLKKKISLRPGYVESLAAIALRVKNERKVIE